MCGHLGVMGKKLGAKHEDAVEDGLFIAALRGTDSVGIGIVPTAEANRKPFVAKRIGMAPFPFQVPFNGAHVIMGHVRSATIGNAKDGTLAHPFKFDNIIGAHNGTLAGDWRKPLQDQTKEVFGSDSQAIFYNFAYWGVEETIKNICGAWCLVWWDDDEQTLNMLRNDERPMWTARSKDGNLYWASEHWMINGMLRAGERDREKLVRTPTEDGKSELFFHKLPVNVWRKWTFDDQTGEVVQLADTPLEGQPRPAPPPKKEYSYDWSGQDWMYGRFSDGSWTEPFEETPEEIAAGGFVRLSKNFATTTANIKGQLYRVVAGESYISRPGGAAEIPFKELIEFRTDGACTCCSEPIVHPISIGYMPKDYSWMICRSCCFSWMGENKNDSWAKALDLDRQPPVAPEEGTLFKDYDENLLLTFGHPPADADADLVGEDDDDDEAALLAEAEKAYAAEANKRGARRGRRRKALSVSSLTDCLPPPIKPSRQVSREFGRWDWWNSDEAQANRSN
jgi:hypothetical protein